MRGTLLVAAMAGRRQLLMALGEQRPVLLTWAGLRKAHASTVAGNQQGGSTLES